MSTVFPYNEKDPVPMEELFAELDKQNAERPFWESYYYWCYHRIRNAYWFIKTRPHYLYIRITKGYNYKDLWSLDIPIAKFIYPRLRDYRKNVHGYPGEFWKEGDDSDDGFNQWLEIIDKMLYTFGHLSKYSDWDLPMDDLETSDIRSHNPKYEAWCKANYEHYKKMQEGSMLLGKYLGALWD
jgi:hypothetical protein